MKNLRKKTLLESELVLKVNAEMIALAIVDIFYSEENISKIIIKQENRNWMLLTEKKENIKFSKRFFYNKNKILERLNNGALETKKILYFVEMEFEKVPNKKWVKENNCIIIQSKN